MVQISGKRNLEKEKRWRQYLEEWAGSKLTATAFCRNKGIEVTTFYSWKKEVSKRDAERSGQKSDAESMSTQFVPIKVKQEVRRSENGEKFNSAEIWLSNGSVVRLGGMNVESLAHLIEKIGRC